MKWITRRRALLFGLIVLIVGGVWFWRSRQASQTPPQTYIVTKQDVKEVIIASGEITAERNATLHFPVPGKLGYINVSEGERVRKGQSLLGMDTTDLASAELEAYYRYLAADANAKEIEDSVKGHDSDETFAQRNDRIAAQVARDIAYDNWREAQRDSKDAHFVSPIAGVVTNITVSAVGSSVGVTDGITIVDPGSLYFSLEVDEADIGKVTLNQKVEITLDAYEDSVFSGTVDRISFGSLVSDSGATIYAVKIKLDSNDLTRLRLGMNGDARIILKEARDVLTLPLEAVSDGQVMLPTNEKKQVEVGIEGEEIVEIKSGLSEGNEVVSF